VARPEGRTIGFSKAGPRPPRRKTSGESDRKRPTAGSAAEPKARVVERCTGMTGLAEQRGEGCLLGQALAAGTGEDYGQDVS